VNSGTTAIGVDGEVRGGMAMRRWTGDEGKGSLGNIIFILVVLAMVYFGAKFIPVQVRAFAFKDAMSEEASFAGHRKDKMIHDNLMRAAREKKIPLDSDMLKIKREPGRIRVTAEYTVVVDTIFFAYDWKFDEEVVRDIY
jgi:hypothetical protein